jgi:CubicO group peptidase (beta-lactamase class C family)
MGEDPRIARVESSIAVETPRRAGGPQPAAIDDLLSYHWVPGASVAVVDAGQIAWARGYGVETWGGAAVTPSTIFQCCSISKHVAAVGALRLVDQGLLDLDEDLDRYLTSWRLPGPRPRVTVRHLLGHTAMLTYCWYRGYRRDQPAATLLDVLEGRPPANTPPVRVVGAPGTTMRYSGSHYSVLQQLMVDLTGQPFPDLMWTLVLDPLGMTDTSYDQGLPTSHPTARGHHDDGEPVRGGWRVIPEMAGAGLWTTAADLARLAVAIQRAYLGDSPFLSKGAVEQALTPGPNPGWGLGFSLSGSAEHQRFGHGGSNIGYRCRTVAEVRGGRGAVVLTNGDWGDAVVDQILDTIAREYGWPDWA